MSEATPNNVKVQVFLALGSNIDPEIYLPLAIKKLGEFVEVIATSSAWQTPAVGFAGDDFLNAVVIIETNLSPDGLKFQVLRKIEAQLDRVRTEEKFSPRTIDIDILIYNEELIDEELWTQPHLAVPLAEIFPNFEKNTGEKLEDISRLFRESSSIRLREGVLKTINY